jgi:DNA-binding MarR family transcriptional regulator
MSSRSRSEIEAATIDTIRGWQTDQDMFDEAVATYAGINRTDFRCLDILDRGGRMTAGQLASAARLTSGAVTAVLDHLEAAGFVRRVRDPGDRRRVLIEVMPDLLAQSMTVYGPIIEEGNRVMSTYSDEQLEAILDFMVRSRDMLARNTTRVLELIEARDREQAGKAG